MKDNRALVLNGRVTPQYNNFTFIKPQGKSVPDHMFCPLEQIGYCKEMKVLLIKDLINTLQLTPPNSLPDHSILRGTFVTSFYLMSQVETDRINTKNILEKEPRIRKN